MAMSHGREMPAMPMAHESMRHAGGGHGQHIHGLKRRFWISLAASLPVLALSPMVQRFLGLGDSLRFPGDSIVLFVVSSFVYFYGGRPFLTGILDELKARRPGMMTLIAVAITTAYALSPMVQRFLGLGDGLRFAGDSIVLFVVSSFVYFYGGWPFLKGIVDELKARRPGMMTLIAMAITTAYVYSSAVVFGLPGGSSSGSWRRSSTSCSSATGWR